MAYNSYFPQYYQPMQQPMPQNQPQMPSVGSQNSNSGIIWVLGEAAAKAYPVASGQAVLLMDSESPVMYIKSTDMSGMPQPLRIFDYKERTQSGTDRGQSEDKSGTADYVSREEFNEFKEEMKKSIKGIRKPRLLEEDEE